MNKKKIILENYLKVTTILNYMKLCHNIQLNLIINLFFVKSNVKLIFITQ